MRYVIIRDDDTNAFTPPECLERLYRPFLDRGLPVNLATIPAVSKSARMADGQREGFLLPKTATHGVLNEPICRGEMMSWPSQNQGSLAIAQDLETEAGGSSKSGYAPLAENQRLVRYLKENRGFNIIQHGCHHDFLEFDCAERAEVRRRLETGKTCLEEAGFQASRIFVAPYDRLSRGALREVAARFRVLSTGWFEFGRLPLTWLPGYAVKKFKHRPHWRVGDTLLLTHPGCLLSCHRACDTMLDAISRYVETQKLAILVTHWWEYFRDGKPNEEFIGALHETASYLAADRDVKVISFDDLVKNNLPLV